MNNDAFNLVIRDMVFKGIDQAVFPDELTHNQVEIIAKIIKRIFHLKILIFKKKLTNEQLEIIADGLKENISIYRIVLPYYSEFYNKNILIQMIINYELNFNNNTLLWDLKNNPWQSFVNKSDFFYCFEKFPLIAVLRDDGFKLLLQNLPYMNKEFLHNSIKLLARSIAFFNLCRYPIKLPNHYLTVEQFINLAKINVKLAEIIIIATNFSQQIITPDDILNILQINCTLGEKIIARNKDLRDIIKIQKLAKKYPELLSPGRYLNRRNFGNFGLKESDSYHETLLYQIGYIYLRDFTNLISPISSLYIPMGKMIIDALNKKPLILPEELINTFAWQCERMENMRNPQTFYCKSLYKDFIFFSNKDTEYVMKAKRDLITLVTSLSGSPFRDIAHLLLKACNQINVGKYDQAIAELQWQHENNKLYTDVFVKLNMENDSLIKNNVSLLADTAAEEHTPKMAKR